MILSLRTAWDWFQLNGSKAVTQEGRVAATEVERPHIIRKNRRAWTLCGTLKRATAASYRKKKMSAKRGPARTSSRVRVNGTVLTVSLNVSRFCPS